MEELEFDRPIDDSTIWSVGESNVPFVEIDEMRTRDGDQNRYSMPYSLVRAFKVFWYPNLVEGGRAYTVVFAINRDPAKYTTPQGPVELKNPVKYGSWVRAQFWARYGAPGYPSGGTWFDAAGKQRIEMDPGGAWTGQIPFGSTGIPGQHQTGASGNEFRFIWKPNAGAELFHIGVNLTIFVNATTTWTGRFEERREYWPISKGPAPAPNQKLSGDQYGRFNVLGPLPPK